jgi:hypothetical protein
VPHAEDDECDGEARGPGPTGRVLPLNGRGAGRIENRPAPVDWIPGNAISPTLLGRDIRFVDGFANFMTQLDLEPHSPSTRSAALSSRRASPSRAGSPSGTPHSGRPRPVTRRSGDKGPADAPLSPTPAPPSARRLEGFRFTRNGRATVRLPAAAGRLSRRTRATPPPSGSVSSSRPAAPRSPRRSAPPRPAARTTVHTAGCPDLV